MEQRLRLQAELKNNISPGLKQIAKDIKSVKQSPAIEATSRALRGLNETTNEFVKGGGGVPGVLGAIGLGGLTAATSIGELARHFRELADHTSDLKELGRQTGLTVDEVNQLRKAAETLQVDPDKFAAGVQAYSDKLVEFKRHSGELYNELATRYPEFARKLATETTAMQLRDISEFLGSIKDPGIQRQWTTLFFGDGSELSRAFANGAHGFEEAWDKAAATLRPITAEQLKQASALHQSIVEFETSWQNFETKVGPTVFAGLKEAADDFRGIFEQLEPIFDWLKGEQGKTASQVVGDVAGLAKDAAADKAAEIGQRWKERAAAASAGVRAGQGEDGNSLHRGDESPAGLFHRSTFVTGFGGSDDGVEGGTKAGVLAALREWMAQSSAANAASSSTAPGLTKASFETWDGPAGSAAASAGRLRGRGNGGAGASYADTPAGAAKDVPGAMSARGLAAMKYLVEKKGWTPEGAAIAVGNAQQESSIRGDGPAGDHGISQHMFQWNHERLAALNRFAAAHGKAATDFQTNLDFLDEERKHRSGLEKDWDKQHDLRNAGRLSHLYEGFGDNSGPTREQNARNWLKAYKDLAGQTGQAARPSLPSLTDEAHKASPPTVRVEGGIEAHIHAHGATNAIRATSTGMISAVNILRAPTMTTANYQA